MTLQFSFLRLLCFFGLCPWFSMQSASSSTGSAGNSENANAKPVVHFTDAAQKAGLTAAAVFGGENTKKYIIETTGTGVAIFDYDNDGNGTFTDVSEKAHVAGSGKAWGTGCAFLDYDRDGELDLLVANYVDFDSATALAPGERPSCMWKGIPVMCGPRGLPGARNILYHNLGNGVF